ncbi:putative oxygenase MesX [Diaphorobacter sp. LI3]|uniref:putative oxygenase MesX n=1 Tax=Diaphorobacter sp. LI3 TaxID=2952886 RepID=UPI003983C133
MHGGYRREKLRYHSLNINQRCCTSDLRPPREERSQLAVKQGKFAEEHFIKPYKNVLEQWAASCAL